MTDWRAPLGAAFILLIFSLPVSAETPAPAMMGDICTSSEPVSATADAIVVVGDQALVSVDTAVSQPPVRALATYGHVLPNPLAVNDINANISGQIERVFVRAGSTVKKGDPIASISSPDFVFTQKSYLTLLGNEERLEILREEGNLPNFLKDARENLKWWGMDEQAIANLTESQTIIEQLSIVAPEDGIVTELLVNSGDVIDAGDRTMQKFVVLGRAIARMVSADAAPILEVYAYPDTAASIQLEVSRIRVKPERSAAQELTVSYVMPEVSPVTQMTRAVVDLAGAEADFTLGDTVPVDILLPAPAGVWIPTATILRQGLRPIAFVQKSADRFERRQLEVLHIVGEWACVANVREGEKLARNGKTILEGAYRQQSGEGSADAGGGHHH
ncbi:efflux RND transporter periplasmic adaptor subunit [Borborobacter arsenicus]|nr:efflux RND transporter periplasmic adaptor subunit [Pseudaminobacter arsenicus]